VSLEQKVAPEADRDAPGQFTARMAKLKEFQKSAQEITAELKRRRRKQRLLHKGARSVVNFV
jgi:hypothetical protein